MVKIIQKAYKDNELNNFLERHGQSGVGEDRLEILCIIDTDHYLHNNFIYLFFRKLDFGYYKYQMNQ